MGYKYINNTIRSSYYKIIKLSLYVDAELKAVKK